MLRGNVAGFRKGLNESGYIEGQNVTVDYHWLDGQYEKRSYRIPLGQHANAARTRPREGPRPARRGRNRYSPKYANGTCCQGCHLDNTDCRRIAGDPVKDGLVASLSRPGGNITGATYVNTQLGGKRLSLLRELVPEGTTVGFLAGGSDWDTYEEQTSNILAAARAVGRQVIILQAPNDLDYEAAFTTLVQRQVGALAVGAFTFRNADKILALAARYKIPTIYPDRGYVVAGGLMGYSANLDEVYRQIGIYAGRILRGERPADLPVVQPTKFDLIVNLKTAKALGLTIPETLLATADEVIQ
jgi:putative ABC transport system substrate-binding protein